MPTATAIRPLLPAQATPLIGRTNELAMVYERLVVEDTRLLTLTGPAGVGKTRLALAAASQMADHLRDGAMFVDLTLLRCTELVLSSLASTVGMSNVDSRSLFARLQDVLRKRQVLLVLDNFEQVLPAAAALADLLASCLELRILVTSRVSLGLRWERVLRIAPLPVPDLAVPLPPLGDLATIPSIALFVQRVRARQADFVLTEKLAHLVARLVVHLDGLPLALELAAARAATLPLPALASRLGDRLHFLRWQAPDVPERQRSLETAVGWSYDLLSEPEQRLFRCLGAFGQRVTLDAVTAVYDEVAGEGEGQGGGPLLDRLISLAEQSLIQPTQPADLGWQCEQREWSDDEEGDDEAEPAFGMLETVREYAEERLASAGELETAHRAHAAYFLALAERANPHLHGNAQRKWLLELEREHDNLQAALRWLLSQEAPADHVAALRLAGALGYFWQLRGYHEVGWHWLEKALRRAPQGEGADRDARAHALLPAGSLRACFGELDQARGHLNEALALAKQQQDRTSIVQALIELATAPLFAGKALSIPLLQKALLCARVLGEPDHVGISLFYLGIALRAQGHTGLAAAHLAEALEQLETAGDVRVAGAVHVYLGALLGQHGKSSDALRHLRAGLATSVRLRSRWLLSQDVLAVLALLGDRTDPGGRARLLGATGALRHAMGAGHTAWERMVADLSEPVLGERLVQEEEAAYREGGALPAGEVAALALRMLDEFGPTLSPSAPATGIQMSHQLECTECTQAQRRGQDGERCGEHLLTMREREVLRLVEHGLSNKAIGQQLFISSRTVSQHLTSVFNKLGVNTRAQAVAVVERRGLI